MRRISGIVVSFCAALSIVAPEAQSQKPNILLIMADDLGYECLSSYGSASYETPELDRLAASGMRFTHCYSQPLCTPSRVQIMTGRYNHRNYTAFGILPKSEITFANLLKDEGYATAVAGKWQLWGTNTRIPEDHGTGQTPLDAGFDDYLLWQLTQLRKSGERYADPLVERMGEGPKILKGDYGPKASTDFLIEFIDAHRDEPFLAYYPMALPHDPHVPTPDSDVWDENPHQRDNRFFADMVAYTDKTIGRIVRHLEATGLRENTLILFVGDNGTSRKITSRMTDGTEILGGKGTPTDAGTRVPFIASWPGKIEAGKVTDALIDFSDFLPSLVAVAGGSLPTDRVLDGKNFMPMLYGDVDNTRDWIFCDYNPRWGRFEHSRFVRNQRWKLYDDGRFYDISNDVLEKTPLEPDSGSEETRSTLVSLQRVLDEMKN